MPPREPNQRDVSMPNPTPAAVPVANAENTMARIRGARPNPKNGNGDDYYLELLHRSSLRDGLAERFPL